MIITWDTIISRDATNYGKFNVKLSILTSLVRIKAQDLSFSFCSYQSRDACLLHVLTAT